MDAVTSLVIDLSGEKIVYTATNNTKFDHISNTILIKWQTKLLNGFKLRYSIAGQFDNCCLDNDQDVASMLIIVQHLGAKIIHVKVLEPTLGNTTTSLPQEQARGHDISTSAFNVDSTSCSDAEARPIKRNRLQAPANEISNNCLAYDVSAVHQEQHLLSDTWESMITGIGQVFPGGAPDFRNTLAKYSTIKGFKYHYNQNSRHRIFVVCQKRLQVEACQWFIRASEVKRSDGELQITDADLNHTCEIIVGAVETQRLSAELMSNLIETNVRENPKMAAKDVKRLLKNAYGVDICYKQAWRALACARDKIFGSLENSSDQLRSASHTA